ncbi:UNKNOWN [Stylonychia lemnae]|uniref:Transmembrane protein n=1 Tax=Stylonychia lemnae TaxID=5949 RepID=A0A078AQJ0_STYLE|nr:UNKNOWN [Stylonychia lemnae]|eukprot:CDW84434.1 UNKNOWN [Stylonychia lemnae]
MTDKIMSLMLFFLNITLICHIIFYSLRIVSMTDQDFDVGYCGGALISVMPVFFFSIAVLFNINKWIYFLLRIQEAINQDGEEFKRNMIILKFIIAGIITGIIISYVVLFSESYFYMNVRIKLWVTVCILSFTLLLRGILNTIRVADETELSKELDESQEQNTYFGAIYDTFMFIFTDMVPILSQLLSMIFGLIRSNNQNQYFDNNKKRIINDSDQEQQASQQQTQLLRTRVPEMDSFATLTSFQSFFDPPINEYGRVNYISNFPKSSDQFGVLRMNRDQESSKKNSLQSTGGKHNMTNPTSKSNQERTSILTRLFKKNTLESTNIEVQ